MCLIPDVPMAERACIACETVPCSHKHASHEPCKDWCETPAHLKVRAEKLLAAEREAREKAEKELREIREAAGVDPGDLHEDLVILVRNAVPQIPHALELMRQVKMLREAWEAFAAGLERDGITWAHKEHKDAWNRLVQAFAATAGKNEEEELNGEEEEEEVDVEEDMQ